MATCRTCAYLRKCIEKATKEGYEHNVNFDPKDGCTGIGYKSNTNADRIRAMSDEELAKILNAFTAYFESCNRSEDEVDCKDCELYKLCTLFEGKAMEWLKQPASEPPKEEAKQDCTYNKNGHCMGQKLMPECDAKNCDRRK